MRLVTAFTCGLICIAPCSLGTAQTVIDFDDAPAFVCSCGEGQPVGPDVIIDNEYARLGVVFRSAGGGLARVSGSNPVSPPNVVTATGPGAVVSYTRPAEAVFRLGRARAVVDYVQITLTNTSSTSMLLAFDLQGQMVGMATGGAAAVLRVDAPGAIHSVIIEQGPMAFDDFTFDGLQIIDSLDFALSIRPSVEIADVTVRGSRPGGLVYLLIGDRRADSPLGPCGELAIADPVIAAAVPTDAAGRATVRLPMPIAALAEGLLVQAVSASSCTFSNAVSLARVGTSQVGDARDIGTREGATTSPPRPRPTER